MQSSLHSSECQDTPYFRSKKKNSVDQLLGKYCILGRIRTKRGIGEQIWFVPNAVGSSAGSCKPRKIFSIFTLM